MRKIAFLLLCGLMLSGCIQNNPENAELQNVLPDSKLQVVATFYPFYDIAKNVAGNAAEVTVLVPPGSEPHDFELTPKDRIALENANVFIVTGADFAAFEEQAVESLDGKTAVLRAHEGIELLPNAIKETQDSKQNTGNAVDPHYWVSPQNAKKIALNIRDGLIKADPEHNAEYELNAQQYVTKLDQLDQEYEAAIKSCKKPVVLTTHNAFAYLARDYSFTQIPLVGLSPETEPTPRQIIDMVQKARQYEVKYLFYDELVDPRVSQTIAREVGATTLVLNNGESVKDPAKETFISILREDLERIKIAMECG